MMSSPLWLANPQADVPSADMWPLFRLHGFESPRVCRDCVFSRLVGEAGEYLQHRLDLLLLQHLHFLRLCQGGFPSDRVAGPLRASRLQVRWYGP
jgi:hypothetical protein